jgi:hypothetical protein
MVVQCGIEEPKLNSKHLQLTKHDNVLRDLSTGEKIFRALSLEDTKPSMRAHASWLEPAKR